MKLSKKSLDVGFFCTELQADRDFWGNKLQLEFQGTLELGEGIVAHPTIQYRYKVQDSIIKVNDYQSDLPNGRGDPSGYSSLLIAGNVRAPSSFEVISGETITLVPKGHLGLTGLGITVTSENTDRLVDFYTEVMQFQSLGYRKVAAGETLIFIEDGKSGTETSTFVGTGFRYLTLHVTNADSALEEIAGRGGKIAMPPVDYGSIARLGFVTDPDGNWIEVAHVNK